MSTGEKGIEAQAQMVSCRGTTCTKIKRPHKGLEKYIVQGLDALRALGALRRRPNLRKRRWFLVEAPSIPK